MRSPSDSTRSDILCFVSSRFHVVCHARGVHAVSETVWPVRVFSILGEFGGFFFLQVVLKIFGIQIQYVCRCIRVVLNSWDFFVPTCAHSTRLGFSTLFDWSTGHLL